MFVNKDLFDGDNDAPDNTGDFNQNGSSGGGDGGGMAIPELDPQARMKQLKAQALSKRKLKLKKQNTGMMMRSQDRVRTANMFTHNSLGPARPKPTPTQSYQEGGGAGGERGIQQLMDEREKKRDMDKESQLTETEKKLKAHDMDLVYDPKPEDTREMEGAPGGQYTLDFSDMRNFVMIPAPRRPGLVIQCYIKRDKKGIKHKMFPTYEMYLSSDQRFLLAGKKRKNNRTSNYIVSMDQNNIKKESAGYIGKLRSNFVGTEFTIYDKGLNPGKMDDDQKSIGASTVRQELGGIMYEPNILGSKGPRKMTCLLPAIAKDGNREVWRPSTQEEGMISKYKESTQGAGIASRLSLSGRRSGSGSVVLPVHNLTTLSNKTPKWNEQVGAYVLNFNGRVTMASVKNFQLVSEQDPETVLLQFGRVGKDVFNVDFCWPLSPFQAFAICMSSFDYKFACE